MFVLEGEAVSMSRNLDDSRGRSFSSSPRRRLVLVFVFVLVCILVYLLFTFSRPIMSCSAVGMHLIILQPVYLLAIVLINFYITIYMAPPYSQPIRSSAHSSRHWHHRIPPRFQLPGIIRATTHVPHSISSLVLTQEHGGFSQILSDHLRRIRVEGKGGVTQQKELAKG